MGSGNAQRIHTESTGVFISKFDEINGKMKSFDRRQSVLKLKITRMMRVIHKESPSEHWDTQCAHPHTAENIIVSESKNFKGI